MGFVRYCQTMKSKRKDDRITIRLLPGQIKRLEEVRERLGEGSKDSQIIKAALTHYFSCEESRLPNGELLNPPKQIHKLGFRPKRQPESGVASRGKSGEKTA